MTISGEVMLGASVRWLLIYLGVATVGAWVPLGLSAEGLAWIAAAAPLAHSALGLALPGQGRLWRRRLGARRASGEEAMAVDDALALLRSVDPGLPGRAGYYVLDDPLPAAAVRGSTLILSRGLIESESLAPVLAHEFGHANSLDGRLTEALNRLAIWDDPLAPTPAEVGAEAGAEFEDDRIGGLLWGCARWTLRLCGGGFVQHLLGPLWAAHWRAREYAADAYAASLGQAEDLARHLTDQVLPLDPPQPGLLLNLAEHPPAAIRIERLLDSGRGTGSK
ncbi:MAG TPA: M48 family metalloprotease [Solirubrobacterales bacterium]|nr:M48 family metalloprotease [Solirubrobacterales bacterium]